MLPFPLLSTPSSDISNNSFYGPINSNFRSMIPDNGALLNIAGNFFYGDPMLYADGCQFCPSNVTQSHLLDRYELNFPGQSRCAIRLMQGYIMDIAQSADKRGEASLRQNCFTLSKQMGCTANETQRSSDKCLAFCSMSRELGPCDGHGACVPPQAGAAEARFTCECDDGFVTTNGTLGSTCARPAPPPAAWVMLEQPLCPPSPSAPLSPALSTGAVVGFAVGFLPITVLSIALSNPSFCILPVLPPSPPPTLPLQRSPRAQWWASLWALLLPLLSSSLSLSHCSGPANAPWVLYAYEPSWHAAWCGMAGRWSDLDVCQEFSMGEILRATDNWASSNVLGKGGFATVYKGVSSKGELWAVKRIALMSNDFETEVRAMASLRHEHVVRLLGFCLHQNVESGQQEQILVYEFVPNGDLKYHIHDSKSPLTLKQRLQLAVGAADGVAYLHSFATPIVHRDLKPGNILVGEHNQAKIADFGLLKLLSHAEGGHDRTRVAGTPGYLDPDYNRTQVVSEKSDVYSFGVVLLELLTRQKAAVEGTDSHISDWVYGLDIYQSSRVLSPHLPYSQAARKVQFYELGELKDAGLEAPDEAVVELADIALDCLKTPASRRPPMKDVARRLQNLLSRYCSDADDVSSLVEPSLRMQGGGVRSEGGRSTDTFGRSEWSEGTNGASAASMSLVHSLSEKWRMIE
ncbi:unnamed protein product [Closterium sp. NIES-54]